MSHSLIEGEDPKPEYKPFGKEEVLRSDDPNYEGKTSAITEKREGKIPGLTRQRTFIELDESSVEKLLNFAVDSDDSDDDGKDSPKKSPLKNTSMDDFDSTSYSLDTVEMHSRLQVIFHFKNFM